MTWPWWPPLTFSAVVGGLPLLGYPVLALVAVMGLSSPSADSGPLVLTLISKAFLYGGLLYPVVYLGCVITAFARRAEMAAAPFLAAVPLLYLAGLLALLGLWAVAERSR